MSAMMKKKGPATHMSEKEVMALDDKQLYTMFAGRNWSTLDSDTRLCLLQEVENRRAKIDGRQPLKVSVKKMDPSLMGACCTHPDGSQELVLNDLFVKVSRFGAHSASEALNTILHEGRHAYQNHCVREGKGKVTKRMILEWMISQETYINSAKDYDLYMLQAIEMDARYFARREIQKINDMLLADGIMDLGIRIQVEKDKQHEITMIKRIRNKLTAERLDALEKAVMDRFKEAHPDVDVSGIRLFEEARLVLKHPELNRLEDVLEVMDRCMDEKLDWMEEVLDELKERLDRMRKAIDREGNKLRGGALR